MHNRQTQEDYPTSQYRGISVLQGFHSNELGENRMRASVHGGKKKTNSLDKFIKLLYIYNRFIPSELLVHWPPPDCDPEGFFLVES